MVPLKNKGEYYFLRCRIFARIRRFLRPIFRRPLPDFLVPKARSSKQIRTIPLKQRSEFPILTCSGFYLQGASHRLKPSTVPPVFGEHRSNGPLLSTCSAQCDLCTRLVIRLPINSRCGCEGNLECLCTTAAVPLCNQSNIKLLS